MTRKRGYTFTKTLRDYIVPIVGLILIGLLIFSVFRGSSDDNVEHSIQYENQIGIDITLDSDVTESYIVYPGESKVKIEGSLSLYKGERVIVKEGSVSLSFPSVGNFRLDKNGELKYEEDGSIALKSSDLWIGNESRLKIDTPFASVFLGAGSHASLSQNEMSSIVYLLSGTAEVRNLAGVEAVLAPGQKIAISRLDASQENVDLSLLKEDIDDFFQSTDWFIKNGGSAYLLDDEENESGSSSGSVSSSSSNILTFHNLTDESYVSGGNINIIGSYGDDSITRIVLNGVEADVDTQNKTFRFEGINTSSRENDLLFKVYDDANDILSKFVYMVYYKGGNDDSPSAGFTVKNYAVDGSNFTFTSPTTKNTYTTYESFVTIKGAVFDKSVASVSVNDYPLKSFDGTYWRYHANVAYNNLKTGTNVYEVKYFDKTGSLIYQNNFTIVKKPLSSQSGTSDVYSDEAQVQ